MATEQEVLTRGIDLIDRVLQRDLVTKVVVLGRGIKAEGVGRLKQSHPGCKVCIVSDETSWQVAGQSLLDALSDHSVEVAGHWNMPATPRPYANYQLVTKVRDFLAQHPETIGIAVGAGTINDLVKRASGELGQPYWVVGTAPSMDGYVASAASISKDGFKQSMPCPASVGAILDIDDMATAPLSMWGSGLGDIIGKISALADWLIADQMEVEKVDPWIWELVEESLLDAVGDPVGVANRENPALVGLIVGCVMSGLSIQAYNDSRPGSGTEHMFSHLWEMEGLGVHDDPPLSHGFKVAVGSVAAAAFYDEFLKMDLTKIDIEAQVNAIKPWSAVEKELDELHGVGPVRNAAQTQLPQKYADEQLLRSRLVRAKQVWPDLQPKLRQIMKPANEVVEVLKTAGVPWHPQMVGLSLADLERSYRRLRSTRKRYISFDLAAEAGVLDQIIDKLFSPQGFWGQNQSIG